MTVTSSIEQLLHRGSNQWDSADPDEDLNNLHKQALSDLGFDNQDNQENQNLQFVMIHEFLHNEIRGSGRILAQLDPARSDTAVKTYAHLIDEEVTPSIWVVFCTWQTISKPS